MAGEAAQRVYELMPQAVARLREMCGRLPEMGSVGSRLLDALDAAVAEGIAEARAQTADADIAELEKTDAYVREFRIIDLLETALTPRNLIDPDDVREFVEFLKGVIGLAKKMKKFPKKWKSIVDEILEVIDKLIKEFAPGPQPAPGGGPLADVDLASEVIRHLAGHPGVRGIASEVVARQRFDLNEIQALATHLRADILRIIEQHRRPGGR